ncbi:MAG: 4-alpha-glucanotransferase [Anaerolineae bacterium]|nr:4-alpha-glucanotransferase [Anaerolineae bacterium]
MRFTRAGGVLVHPTSFPGRYGIGDLGDAAYGFVDFLEQYGQGLWQVLPLGPTGYGDSPYQSFSAFAGNPLLLSPDHLVRDGYLPASAIADVPDLPHDRVDFGPLITYKNALLDQALHHYRLHGSAEQQQAYAAFCVENAAWVDDYALFMALKTAHQAHEGGVWNTWPSKLAHRDPAALQQWHDTHADDVERYRFLQFLFFEQWSALRRYANAKGIRIIGDAPIFVAYDSADVWANPGLFYLDDEGAPEVVAGVPPDYFSATGQRWGNPLYRWDVMHTNRYAWWQARLRAIFRQVDIVRLDHFRGFAAYWEIPADEPTAVVGRWVDAPGMDFFHTLEADMGELPIIAEDLGVITEDVELLRDTFAFPGMKVLQFGFGGERNNAFLPHTYTQNAVVYTGTHDNDTTLGWYLSAEPGEQDHIRRYVASSGNDIVWDMIRLAYASVADMAVVPLQDLMILGTEARMNFPGKLGGNWQWRFTADMLTEQIGWRLRELSELYGRLLLVEQP